MPLLKDGGLWKYSGDSQETVQCQCKTTWMNFSARGAKGRVSPPLVVMQRHLMKTHLCSVEYGPHHLVALDHERRRLLELESQAEDMTEFDWEL